MLSLARNGMQVGKKDQLHGINVQKRLSETYKASLPCANATTDKTLSHKFQRPSSLSLSLSLSLSPVPVKKANLPLSLAFNWQIHHFIPYWSPLPHVLSFRFFRCPLSLEKQYYKPSLVLCIIKGREFAGPRQFLLQWVMNSLSMVQSLSTSLSHFAPGSFMYVCLWMCVYINVCVCVYVLLLVFMDKLIN